ncbi:MAG: UDP-N-acetylmuramate dehydrogenase [Clostridia bacterium]|nr:UDP-N-acetylmuramate dehydrogenase [Clostridia bacterium]
MAWQTVEQFCVNEEIQYSLNESMKLHTSFHIGGNADLFISPENENKLCALLSFLKAERVPFMIIGRGSNLVVSDDGICGAVISLAAMNKVELTGSNRVSAGAGASLAALCTYARDCSLSGLEFAYGIPGSVGGALYMNAGAYGGEMKDVVLSARVLSFDGEIFEMPLQEMELSYRHSIFKEKNMTVLSVSFELKQDEKQEINARMDDFMNRRKTKQPLEYPSAGSVFKRPEGYFAGALIEKNGFKGVSVGGAQVSEKHAGFIINTGSATAKDVKELIKIIQQKVLEQDKVELHTELIFVGR